MKKTKLEQRSSSTRTIVTDSSKKQKAAEKSIPSSVAHSRQQAIVSLKTEKPSINKERPPHRIDKPPLKGEKPPLKSEKPAPKINNLPSSVKPPLWRSPEVTKRANIASPRKDSSPRKPNEEKPDHSHVVTAASAASAANSASAAGLVKPKVISTLSCAHSNKPNTPNLKLDTSGVTTVSPVLHSHAALSTKIRLQPLSATPIPSPNISPTLLPKAPIPQMIDATMSVSNVANVPNIPNVSNSKASSIPNVIESPTVSPIVQSVSKLSPAPVSTAVVNTTATALQKIVSAKVDLKTAADVPLPNKSATEVSPPNKITTEISPPNKTATEVSPPNKTDSLNLKAPTADSCFSFQRRGSLSPLTLSPATTPRITDGVAQSISECDAKKLKEERLIVIQPKDSKKVTEEWQLIHQFPKEKELTYTGNVRITCSIPDGTVLKIINGNLLMDEVNPTEYAKDTLNNEVCVGNNVTILAEQGYVYCHDVGVNTKMTAEEIECEDIETNAILKSTVGSIRAINVAGGAQLNAKTDIVAKQVEMHATLIAAEGTILASKIMQSAIVSAKQGAATKKILVQPLKELAELTEKNDKERLDKEKLEKEKMKISQLARKK